MVDKKNKLTELEVRIKAARSKFDFQPKKPMYSGNVGLHLVGDLVGGLAVGAILGYNLDGLMNTKPLFMFILVVLGICGGFYNFYKYEMNPRSRKLDE